MNRYGYSSVAEGDLKKFSDIGAWYAIEDYAQYDKNCSNLTSVISDETIANLNSQIVGDDMVRVQVPRCMAWLDYDEHVYSLSMMDNEVGVTSLECTTQTLPSFEEYTPLVTYPEEFEKTLGTPIEKIRIKQYFQVQDYALWDAIENGNSFKPTAQTTTNVDGSSPTLIPCPVTADEKTQKKNDYKDAKTLFAAIQTRFGGNDATKKTQKTLLKQMYENFSAPSTESLNSIFNRLQKIVSQLAILSEYISQEDLILKFLRSLPSEWNTHVVVWRNKSDLDTMSFDDL
ncbi:hypothetical protein Tco_0842543 [Tanacetum coccineum]|uniref:Uncharacterized protein n=1 Tax=Tanacetum coccineum TaxID=301880 RepID=A0ABQ5B0G0_9ASTR